MRIFFKMINIEVLKNNNFYILIIYIYYNPVVWGNTYYPMAAMIKKNLDLLQFTVKYFW